MTYSCSDLADDVYGDIIQRNLGTDPLDYQGPLEDAGYQVRHDKFGFYVCSAAEGEHEDQGHESAGFDGRPHFAGIEETARAWCDVNNVAGDDSAAIEPSKQADIIMAGIAKACGARDQALQLVAQLCDLLDEAHGTHIWGDDDEHPNGDCDFCGPVKIARALIAGTATPQNPLAAVCGALLTALEAGQALAVKAQADGITMDDTGEFLDTARAVIAEAQDAGLTS